MKNKIDYLQNLLQSCLLPELNQDLDGWLIKKETFLEFHKILKIRLPILYDFVYKNIWIFTNEDQDSRNVRAHLYILLCEITATSPVPVYKLENELLVKYAEDILVQYRRNNYAVDNFIFVHFQNKLQKKTWKRQLGAIHGFLRYLNYRYNTNTSDGNNKMSTQWLIFCLSVGLCVRESHDPMYKQVGTQIFLIMLNQVRLENLQSTNVYSVIYDDVYKDVHRKDTVFATELTWKCLIKCLDFYEEIDILSWNRADDMIGTLLRNITLTSNSTITICLLKAVRSLTIYFAPNRYEIQLKCNEELDKNAVSDECRIACAANSSYTSFRWVKSILNVIIVESYKFMQCPIICQQLLEEIHKCYLVSVLPIDLTIIEPLLINFFDKFPVTLMKVLLVQKHNERIRSLVRDIINTFHLHLQSLSFIGGKPTFLKYLKAFENFKNRLSTS